MGKKTSLSQRVTDCHRGPSVTHAYKIMISWPLAWIEPELSLWLRVVLILFHPLHFKNYSQSWPKWLKLRRVKGQRIAKKEHNEFSKPYVIHKLTWTPKVDQHILQTNELKTSLAHARELASNLPGGYMSLTDQDAVIDMLTKLRATKRFASSIFLVDNLLMVL